MSVSELKKSLLKNEAYLILSRPNIKYLTGFSLDDGYLIVTEKKSVMLADSRYIEAAQSSALGCDEIIQLKAPSEQLPEILKSLDITQVYTEESNISVADLRRIEKLLDISVKAEKTDSVITALRRSKKDYEKKKILEAQAIAEAAFSHILGFIKVGVTERELGLDLDYFMLKNGAEALSFDTIAISGKNTSKPHGVPSDKIIEDGDFVTMDYGAVVDGYHSDMTRTVAVGHATDKMVTVYNTVLKAQQACLDILKAGISCRDADAAARDVIREAGFGSYFGHGTGHGVGIDIHEAPSLSPRSDAILQAGDVVTDEPGIYIPGEFGVRIEDMAFILPEGYENLTKCEKSLIIL